MADEMPDVPDSPDVTHDVSPLPYDLHRDGVTRKTIGCRPFLGVVIQGCGGFALAAWSFSELQHDRNHAAVWLVLVLAVVVLYAAFSRFAKHTL